MDVEIDDRGALGAVLALGVARRDRGVVEQAEAHRPRGLGVVAGRADGDEGVGRPCRSSPRRPRAPRRRRARSAASKLPGDIEVSASICTMPCCGVASRTAVDVVHRMAERDGLESCGRRFDADQRLESVGRQRALDRAQPVRPLRMAGAA